MIIVSEEANKIIVLNSVDNYSYKNTKCLNCGRISKKTCQMLGDDDKRTPVKVRLDCSKCTKIFGDDILKEMFERIYKQEA